MRVITTGGNALYFLHGDHLGSTSLTTDQNGSVVARQLYDAWGNIRASAASGTMPTDIGYTGQRLDATGLMYFRARYYAQGIGRFLSADTLVPSASDPQQLNRYAYARGNPVRYTDPTGHYIFEDDPNEGLVYDAERVKKYFGVDVRLRESNESWVRDTGHHPTDAEFIGTFFGVPLIALGGALLPEVGGIPGVIQDLSWKATVACANNPVCATVVMGAGAQAVGDPNNPVPSRVARIIPARFAAGPSLARPGASDAFVTAVDDIAGIDNSVDLARRLTLVDEFGNQVKGPFAVLEFDAPLGIASPIFRTNPGFVGQGLTQGGAREYVVPNYLLDQLQNLITRIIQ
jgi:RHS repeat-associated protein